MKNIIWVLLSFCAIAFAGPSSNRYVVGQFLKNGSGIFAIPSVSTNDQLVGRATTDTLTNKTLTGNTAVNLISGSGVLILNTTGTITVPSATDQLVGRATTDTLTNKTLTSPAINTATIANPTFTGTILTPLTASSAVATDGSSNLAASSTTATELGYVHGVTSAIQTQIGSLSSAASSSYQMTNCSVAEGVGSSILTISLKDASGSNPSGGSPCTVSMRSGTATTPTYNIRTISSSLSQTITLGTTLGAVSTVAQNLWFYLIDSDGAGTMKIGVSSVYYDPTVRQNTVPESVAVTATNASPAVFTVANNGFNNGDAVALTGTAPTGFTNGTVYYVVASGPSSVELAATPGGSAINSSSTGTSVVMHVAGSRLASDFAYGNVAVRVIGFGTYTETTAGTWASTSSIIKSGFYFPDAINQIYAVYQDAAGMTIPASTTTIVNFNTKVVDNTNNVTTGAAWKFIAPIAGTYEVSVNIYWASQAWASTNTTTLNLYKNGSLNQLLSATELWASVTAIVNSMHGTLLIPLVQNDYIDARVFETNASSRTLQAAGSTISVRRIGN